MLRRLSCDCLNKSNSQGPTISGNHGVYNIWKMVSAGEKMLKYNFYRGWYWPSIGAIVNVVHRGLALYFQDHTISGNHIIYNIWKTVRAVRDSEKCTSSPFMKVDISHEYGAIANAVQRYLDLSNCKSSFSFISPWPKCSRPKVNNINISQTVRASAKMPAYAG